MEQFRLNQVYYKLTADLQLEPLTFKGTVKTSHYFHDQYGAEVRLNDLYASQLMISRVMALTELEEKLRYRINFVHDQLKRHKITFNPINGIETIEVRIVDKGKEVHQYDITTGLYINSYPTINTAYRAVTGDVKGNDKMISRQLNEPKRRSAHGYRWSFERVTKLPRLPKITWSKKQSTILGS